MSQPVDSPAAPAPTVRDEIAITRLDGPAPTVRHEALPPRTLMQLPSALAGRYRIVRPLPTAGGEADLLLVDAGDGQRYVAKLYRYGIPVKREVLDRLQQAGSAAVKSKLYMALPLAVRSRLVEGLNPDSHGHARP